VIVIHSVGNTQILLSYLRSASNKQTTHEERRSCDSQAIRAGRLHKCQDRLGAGHLDLSRDWTWDCFLHLSVLLSASYITPSSCATVRCATLLALEKPCLAWISRSSCASMEPITTIPYEPNQYPLQEAISRSTGQHRSTCNMCSSVDMDGIFAGGFASWPWFASLIYIVYQYSVTSHREGVSDSIPPA
jgi:hypothetical protein